MKLKLHFLSYQDYHIVVYLDGKKYECEKGIVILETDNRETDIRISLRYKNSKTDKEFKYLFSFHEKDSVEIFQHKKHYVCIDSFFKLVIHRDATIVFDIKEHFIKNQFNTSDKYCSFSIKSKSNVKIIKNECSYLSNKSKNKLRLIEAFLVFIRITVVLLLCIWLSVSVYKNPAFHHNIFQGEGVWVLIYGYYFMLVAYVVSFLYRTFRYYKDLKSKLF